MLFMAQRIEHQCMRTAALIQLCRRYKIGIGNVGERADAEAQHLQLIVHYPDRDNFQAVDRERCAAKLMQVYLRDAGVRFVTEYIGKFPPQDLQGIGIAIYVHRLFLVVVVGAHIIEACCMVFVAVREHDGIEPAYAGPQHLVAEIGAAVDHDAGLRRFDPNGGAQPLVFRERRGAYRAIAANKGNTL